MEEYFVLTIKGADEKRSKIRKSCKINEYLYERNLFLLPNIKKYCWS